MIRKIKYSVLFLLIGFIFTAIFWLEKEEKIDSHLRYETNKIVLNYNSIYSDYKKIADIIYKTKINTAEIIDIFKDAHKTNEQEQSRIRKELYEHLFNTYEMLKSFKLKQLHFHLPNNNSFLRFHRPNKFGDNLEEIRETVSYVNKHKKAVDGFEEGRIYDGYRFVFPLFDKQNSHIGSVEISFSTLALISSYHEYFKDFANFLLSKEIVDKKVFENEKKNYTQSHLPSFYIEKKILNYVKNKTEHQKNLNYLSVSKPDIDKIIRMKKPFAVYDRYHEFYFIPITNPITKIIEGVFIVKQPHHFIPNKIQNFYTLCFIVWLFSAISIYFFNKNANYKLKLQDNNKRLQTVIEEADSGIGMIDLQGDFLEVNTTYTKLLGYSKEELLRSNCIELTVDEQKETALEYLKKAKIEGSISKIHKMCTKKDGSIIHLEFSLNLLPSKKAFIAVINSMEEKLQLKRLNENLIEEVGKKFNELKEKDQILQRQSRDAAMGEMIDAIAHQWKNPLNTIKLYTQSYEMEFEYSEKPDIEKLQKISSKIDNQVNHLLNTLEEFRAFFRPDPQFKEISLHNILNSVLILMKDELIKNHIETQIVIKEDYIVKVIPNEFKHVIINMITNSRDAFNENNTANKKIIFDILDDKEDNVIFNITDNAGGIPKDILHKVFESNFTTKGQGKGTGIGLYMTKQILDKNNANVKVYNTHNGVCFSISLKKYNQDIS